MDKEKAYAHGMWMHSVILGGVITTGEMAVGFAEVVLKGLFGQAELLKQQPLEAFDEGDAWLVEGAYSEPGRQPGTLSFYILIKKYDARVVTLGFDLPMDIPDDVKTKVEAAKARKARADKAKRHDEAARWFGLRDVRLPPQ